MSVIALLAARRRRRREDAERSTGEPAWRPYRPALAAGLVLLVGGVGVYLPMGAVSGRYTMPAVWGLDLALAVLLSAFAAVPPTAWKRAAYLGLAVGLVAVALANIGKQEKFAARRDCCGRRSNGSSRRRRRARASPGSVSRNRR